jgi:hypothetical protein
MGLLDDLTDPEKLHGQVQARCTVCILLKALDPKESQKLNEVMNNPNVTKVAVARILKDNGYKIAPNTITRHTRRECSTS